MENLKFKDMAVKEYLQAFGARKEAASAARPRPPEPSFSAESDYLRVILTVVGIGILIAGIAYGGYRLYGYLTVGQADMESLPLTTATESAPDLMAVATPTAEPLRAPEEGYEPAAGGGEAFSEVAEAPGSDALISAAPAAEPVLSEMTPSPVSLAPEDLALRIDSHGTVWLSITADGVRQWQGTMRANQSREVQAAESVRLTVGDAGAVSLTLNGKSLPGLGRPGEVRNLTITARDAAETTP
jgi:hypothetical protein